MAPAQPTESRSEQRGATPIEPELTAIRGAHSADEMAGLTGRSVLFWRKKQ